MSDNPVEDTNMPSAPELSEAPAETEAVAAASAVSDAPVVAPEEEAPSSAELTSDAEVVAASEQEPDPESPTAAEPEPEATAPAEPEAEATAPAEPEAEVTAPAEPEPEATAPPEPEPEAPAAVEVPAAEVPAPAPTSAPRPGPPRITPAALAGRIHAPAHSVPAPPPPSESARFGRVADDGTVYVTDGDTERPVGSYPDASNDDALQYFARKYDELLAQADLLHQRLTAAEVPAKEAGDSLTALQEHTAEPMVVGDLAALRERVAGIETMVAERREAEAAERAAAKAQAATEREALVAEAETIAGQPVDKVQWKSSSERMRGLLDQWKQHQRSGPKLDKPTENALWQRFSHARNSFDKARRTHFAQLEDTQAGAKRAKDALVKEAEQLATSKDWAPTARAFKGLMDQWRLAGRASRNDDDALWARFKAAQDAFFAAKDEVNAAEDQEFRANLAVKEQLLTEAQAILSVTNLEAAKAQLRVIQDKWDKAGKVPRGDIERIEKVMRRVESTVREAEDAKWKTSNPEVAARANSMVTQLEASIAGISDDLAKAEAAGNARKVKDLTAKLEAQQAWLAQARAGLGG